MKSKLTKYHEKRKFDDTPEPSDGAPSTGKRLYVIQKHDASHLHYDFRLEHKGVLLSWAVPKGPSLDPTVKRLAVHVEDHPVSYGGFSGKIPEGNYGAGTVEIWDTGSWEPIGDVDKMLKEGSLKFTIFGGRLHGKWALIRFQDQDKNWLLIKEKDDFAMYGDDDKVLDRATSSQPKPKVLPILDYRNIQPQLATLGQTIPTSDDWLHEIKYDGYRLLVWRLANSVRLITRGGLDWTKKFPDIARAIQDYIPVGTGLDGEVVVFSKEGLSDFGGLQRWLKDGHGDGIDPQLIVFDLLQQDGKSMMSTPLLERKERLKALLDGLPKESTYWIRYSDHIVGRGKSMVKEACQKGLEGIVSKNIHSKYVQARTDTWVKTKCVKQEEFVIGGYTEPSGSRHGFGALLLGQYDPNGILQYVGKVGSGFTDSTLTDLLQQMERYHSDSSPFGPSGDLSAAKGWVKPKLVAQVRYTERTKDGMLRHSVFIGLREDKAASEVTPEKPMETETSKELSVTITHPERVLFPEPGITKLGLAEYYDRVAERMMPFMHNRPIAIVRCPDGPQKACFFQKHRGPGMPTTLEKEVKGEDEPLISVSNKDALLSLVQFGAIELHAWASTFEKIEQPDVMIFDLDPGPGVAWKTVIQSAEVLAEYLRTLGFKSFAKISGGKGIHVVVPIKPGSLDWDDFKNLAHAIANSLDAMIPDQFVTVASKAKREKKIFIDYLRNGRGSTAIVPYAVRANAEASVAVPISWEKLGGVRDPKAFTISNCEEWLKDLEDDPWKEIFTSATTVEKDIWERVGLEHSKSLR